MNKCHFRKRKFWLEFVDEAKLVIKPNLAKALLETMHSVFEKVEIVVERMDPGDRNDMGPKKVIDWLLESDYHIIRTSTSRSVEMVVYSHNKIVVAFSHFYHLDRFNLLYICVCTGHFNQCPSDWKIDDVVQQLQRLHDHPGFPNGDFLNCPVFLQDKIAYLDAVKDIALPTLKVNCNNLNQ